jgi:hypothetical protein
VVYVGLQIRSFSSSAGPAILDVDYFRLERSPNVPSTPVAVFPMGTMTIHSVYSPLGRVASADYLTGTYYLLTYRGIGKPGNLILPHP